MSTSTTSYYSLEGILTENEKATCTFELDVPLLSVLNAGSKVETGTKLELPLWIAERLAVSPNASDPSKNVATLDLPASLGPQVMNALRAGPTTVKIRQQSMNFFGVGERMLELFDEDEVAEVLNEAFKQRALEIADQAQNHRNEMTDFRANLDDHEKRLYDAAFDGSKAVKDWFDTNRV